MNKRIFNIICGFICIVLMCLLIGVAVWTYYSSSDRYIEPQTVQGENIKDKVVTGDAVEVQPSRTVE